MGPVRIFDNVHVHFAACGAGNAFSVTRNWNASRHAWELKRYI